ncbi:hypothetical protein, partial [Streptomyces sp. BE133]|uniref:hypothetical protein n=1 Tax=Streptomyces sp. BE133 TaxID=3002523 RepID=UPI002E774921
PRGWAALRASDTAGAAVDYLSVFMDMAARDQIVAAAAAAGNQVTDDVNEGYQMVMTGEYTPLNPIRSLYCDSV